MADTFTANPDLDAFVLVGGWAQFAPQAYAQVTDQVMDKLKSKDLVIVAGDTLPPQMEALKAGRSHVQVGQRPFEMGYRAPTVMIDLINGKTVERPALHRPRRMHAGDCRHLPAEVKFGETRNELIPLDENPTERKLGGASAPPFFCVSCHRQPLILPDLSAMVGHGQRADPVPAAGDIGSRDAAQPPAREAGRVLRWLGIAIVAVVAVAIVVAFLLPRHAIVTRSVEIAAPPSALFPMVGDLRRFNEWSPWADIDPAAVYTFTGPSTASGRPSTGRATTSGSEPGRCRSRRSSRTAGSTWRSTSSARGTALAALALEPAGAGTKVTWGLRQRLSASTRSRATSG